MPNATESSLIEQSRQFQAEITRLSQQNEQLKLSIQALETALEPLVLLDHEAQGQDVPGFLLLPTDARDIVIALRSALEVVGQ